MRNLTKYIFVIWLKTILVQEVKKTYDPQDLSTYEYMDRYNMESSLDRIHEYCKGFICEKSGLSEVSIVLLVNKENQVRNKFAGFHRLSNVYLVKWDSHLARAARRKVMLCLPPTSKTQHIFDSKILTEIPNFHQLNDSRTVKVVEVLIGSKTSPINDRDIANVYTSMANQMGDFLDEEHFNQFDAHGDGLSRRGSTLIMGCDYLVRNNATHVLCNIVCIYGILYFHEGYYNDYNPKEGKPCSECDEFYRRHPSFTTGTNYSRKWACDLEFPYLCRDRFDSMIYAEPSQLYPCPGMPLPPPPENLTYTFITVPPSEYYYTTMPPHKWPCFQYSVPILLLTFIILTIFIYHVVIIIIILIRIRRRKTFP